MSIDQSFDDFVDQLDLPENLRTHVEKEIEPIVPHAMEFIFGERYNNMPVRQRKRAEDAKARDAKWREGRFDEGFQEKLYGLK